MMQPILTSALNSFYVSRDTCIIILINMFFECDVTKVLVENSILLYINLKIAEQFCFKVDARYLYCAALQGRLSKVLNS